jgi:hypothetical protein
LISSPEQRVLEAMAGGWTLKAHRYLDGRKEYQLHPLQGPSENVAPEVVAALVDEGLIDSNKKFPAATFWLTDLGRGSLAGGADQRKT